ncbi:cell division protein ZapA [Anoxynatronum buryatiense]|uniref:Cell division protein ZapA n=1 Tax=Anoxynatronum buryatiense TaxID=489973 RepID=A0AA45WT59_9CLOT|nr:cell division protein ZapA [Anoxynatronum buryatiense]SMP40669.1 cell division protein ZapA [Anoxynatronum buryatiense]
MSEKKNRVLIRINGQEYPIAGKESKEYLIRVGSYVDEKMQEVSRLNRQLSVSQISVLTAINVADEMLKLRDAYETLQHTKPPTNEELSNVKQELDQKNGSLQQEKEYSRTLQRKLNNVKQDQEKLRESNQQLLRQLREKDQELVNAQEIIGDLQEQLYENQMKVATLEKQQGQTAEA